MEIGQSNGREPLLSILLLMHLLSLTRPALWQVDTKVITRLSWKDFVLCNLKTKLDFCVSGWFELVCRLNIIRLNWSQLRQNYTSLGLEFILFWIDFLRLHWKCDQVHNPSSVFAVSWTYMNVLLFLLFFLWGGCTSRFNIVGPFHNVLSIAILQ